MFGSEESHSATIDGFSEYDSEKGIPLAIDPNLISIPAAKPIVAESKPSDDAEAKDSDVIPVSIEDSQKTQKSLIQNPYEYYGQMPLQQFIPLMLEQRGPGVKFADISEELLRSEMQDARKVLSAESTNDIIANDGPMGSSKDEDGDFRMDKDESAPEAANVGKEDEGNANELPMASIEAATASTEDGISHEEFISVKKKVLEHVNMALNESSLSLEFISLLLSSTRTSAGTSSMSSYLKKIAPPASLNADRIPLDMLEEREKLVYDMTRKGWNIRSLEECKQLLKQHYMILSKSVKSEHHYWKEISDNISNKDVLFKMKDGQTSKKTLGIKYGFEDSGSCYSADKGIAVLRGSSDGSQLELIPLADSKRNPDMTKVATEQYVRVRIFTKIEQEDDYILSGQSSLNQLFLNTENDIKTQIAKLRVIIFEKELMHQLKKEAVQLLPYGVLVENENKIVMDLSNEKIEIELIALDDEVLSNCQQEAPKINDKRANLILTMLNMLLVVMYKKQIWKKLNPNPNTGRQAKGYGKDLVLLRAILGKIRHKKYKQLVENIMHNTVLNKKEGLVMTVNEGILPPNVEVSKNRELATLQREIGLFDTLLTMPRTDFTTNVPEKGSLEISLRSTNHCNAVVYMKFTDDAGAIKFDTKFSEFTEFEEFLNFVYNEFLV